MTTTDMVRQLLQPVCANKEQAVRSKAYFSGAVHFWRGEEIVAVAMPRDHQRDELLRFARVGGVGFSADLIAISMDTFVATETLNPMTGEPWGQHEMQLVAEKYHGRERGWVTDSISIVACNRAGDQWIIQRHYKEQHRRVIWDEPIVVSSGDGIEAGGTISEELEDIMVNSLSLDQLTARKGLTPAAVGLSEAAGRAHMDCASIKMMAQARMEGSCMLYAEPGSERAKVIAMSLGSDLLLDDDGTAG